jgi:short-subunit dehydrogenase
LVYDFFSLKSIKYNKTMRFFITGISRGLGRALAEEGLKRGHEVWGVSRSLPRGLDKRIRHTLCDIGKREDIDRAFDRLKKAMFVPDIVILNAAAIRPDYKDKGLDTDAMEEGFNTNVIGGLRLISLFMPEFLAGQKGVFINISSVVSFIPVERARDKVSYPATKAAMDKAFEALRLRSEGSCVSYVTINLGPLSNAGGMPFFKASYDKTAKMIIGLGERRGGCPSMAFSYPFLAGLVYKLASLVPERIVKRLIRSL